MVVEKIILKSAEEKERKPARSRKAYELVNWDFNSGTSVFNKKNPATKGKNRPNGDSGQRKLMFSTSTPPPCIEVIGYS